MNIHDLKQIAELLDQKLEEKLNQKLEPIQQELKNQEKLLEGQTKRLDNHEVLLKRQGTMLKSIKKNQDTMLDMLDREQMDQRKRIKRIEDHLLLSPAIAQ